LFDTRVISIALLFLYGIPAASGPHWHHHDGDHACCAGHHHSDDHAHGSAHQQDSAVCACGAHDHANKSSDDCGTHEHELTTQPIAPVRAKAAHGPCSICNFYAAAQSHRVLLPTLAVCTRGTPLECTSELALLGWLAASRARGPPPA